MCKFENLKINYLIINLLDNLKRCLFIEIYINGKTAQFHGHAWRFVAMQYFLSLSLFWVCSVQGQELNPSGKTIAERFVVPKGYQRITTAKGTFANYLRSFPLETADAKVRFYDGQIKSPSYETAVLAIDVGQKDLQQCADAVMRLRSEYLYQEKEWSKIGFKNFAGERMDYVRYQQGYRMTAKGYQKVANPDYSKAGFRQYLDMVFNYANTFTFEKELTTQPLKNLQVGDVFIVSNPKRYGHAMLVMDVAENPKTKDKVFLLAQSYMPAQSIHIVQNPSGSISKVWYSVGEITDELVTPEWTFTANALRRF